MAGPSKRKTRSNIALLADGELIAQADGRNAWDGHRVHGNIATSWNDFDSTSNVHCVAGRLVYLHQNMLTSLVHDGAERLDAGPVENPEIVEIAFCLQET